MTDGAIEGEFYAELGRNLVSKRKERGIGQSALALELGVHRNTLMRWESGESAIPMWEMLRIADLLSCNHLLLMPRRELTWGPDYAAVKRERDRVRKPVQSERDRRVTDYEAAKLRKVANG